MPKRLRVDDFVTIGRKNEPDRFPGLGIRPGENAGRSIVFRIAIPAD